MTDTERLHYVRVCEKLAAETHAREVAEAELRETAGELERESAASADWASRCEQNWQRVQALETRLAEATALLERCRRHPDVRGKLYEDLCAYASRAPAQPAAPTPEAVTMAAMTAEMLAQMTNAPAHLTPRHPAAPDTYGPPGNRTTPGYWDKPAAPEPSAELQIVTYDGQAWVREERLEYAESKLAAVLNRIQCVRKRTEECDENDSDEARQCIIDIYRMTSSHEIALLTPAGSNGGDT